MCSMTVQPAGMVWPWTSTGSRVLRMTAGTTAARRSASVTTALVYGAGTYPFTSGCAARSACGGGARRGRYFERAPSRLLGVRLGLTGASHPAERAKHLLIHRQVESLQHSQTGRSGGGCSLPHVAHALRRNTLVRVRSAFVGRPIEGALPSRRPSGVVKTRRRHPEDSTRKVVRSRGERVMRGERRPATARLPPAPPGRTAESPGCG